MLLHPSVNKQDIEEIYFALEPNRRERVVEYYTAGVEYNPGCWFIVSGFSDVNLVFFTVMVAVPAEQRIHPLSSPLRGDNRVYDRTGYVSCANHKYPEIRLLQHTHAGRSKINPFSLSYKEICYSISTDKPGMRLKSFLLSVAIL